MPHRKEEELTPIYGWMVAANPIGQMIFSPILGMVTGLATSVFFFLITNYFAGWDCVELASKDKIYLPQGQ